jgi:uncharacterized protein YheU (UPF0270 family)
MWQQDRPRGAIRWGQSPIVADNYSRLIRHTQLSRAALQAVVEEFVTRDGTDRTSVEQRIEVVLRQLEAGRVELHFDDESETCNIVPV